VPGRFGDACAGMRHALAIMEALEAEFPDSPDLKPVKKGVFAESLKRAFYLILAQTILWVIY
jgi:hypothetical protein